MRNPNKRNKPKHTCKGKYKLYAQFLNVYNEPTEVYEFRHEPTKPKCVIVEYPDGDLATVVYKYNKYILK